MIAPAIFPAEGCEFFSIGVIAGASVGSAPEMVASEGVILVLAEIEQFWSPVEMKNGELVPFMMYWSDWADMERRYWPAGTETCFQNHVVLLSRASWVSRMVKVSSVDSTVAVSATSLEALRAGEMV